MHVTLDPVHRKCCGDTVARRTRARPPLGNSSAPRPAETFGEFRETAMPMLLALGPYAYSDPVLLYKIIRIIKASLGISAKGRTDSSFELTIIQAGFHQIWPDLPLNLAKTKIIT